MEFVTLSHRHELVPFHLRLVNQGAEAYLLVAEQAYESALSGKVKIALRNNGEICAETIDTIRGRVAEGKAILLTNRRKHSFNEGKVLGVREFPDKPQGILRLGAWYDAGFHAIHLLIVDEGIWPGGLGPRLPGGLTLIHLPYSLGPLEDYLAPFVPQLHGFVGLVQFGIQLDDSTGRPGLAGIEAGWPWLQSHAFISELENFAGLMDGDVPVFTAGKKFVVVVPVSVPPWPNKGRAREQQIGGLTPAYTGKFWWHDAKVEGNQLWSAGLDGLLGVARGAGGTLELARSTATGLASVLQVPEKQFRPDVAAVVPTVLAQLEAQWGVIV